MMGDEVVGERLHGGEDDGVAEDASLHVVLAPPVADQTVLTDLGLVTNGTVELILMLNCLMILSCLCNKW